jgi:hypothetical protein
VMWLLLHSVFATRAWLGLQESRHDLDRLDLRQRIEDFGTG